MHDKIQCPNCTHKFDVEEAIAGQIQAQLQKKYEAKMAESREAINQQKRKLAEEKAAFDQKKERENELFKARLEEKLNERLKVETEKIEQEKLEELSLKLTALEKDNEAKKLENRKLKEKEIALLKEKAALKDLQEELQLQMEKELLEKATQIENKGRQKERESSELKIRELQKQLEDQMRLTEEMKRKQEQGSMQLQGEVQELAIEEWLTTNFPFDEIVEIKKGARGGDCIQKVRTHTNPDCGQIVSNVLPKGEDRMCLRDGIWICTYEEFKGLCFVLRQNIITISNAVASQENKGDKMVMLYNFLTSNEFKLQIEAIVEGFTQMQADLETEKRSLMGHWKKREKQLQKVLLNTNHMYNSFKGIAGNAIMPIDQLEFGEDSNLLEEKAASPSEVYDLDKKARLKKNNQLFE